MEKQNLLEKTTGVRIHGNVKFIKVNEIAIRMGFVE
jgi:hypothetical protein